MFAVYLANWQPIFNFQKKLLFRYGTKTKLLP